MNALNNLARFTCCAATATVLCAGCSTKMGQFVPSSQFVYPNSNVTALGPVKHERSKTTFFVSPRWRLADTKKTYQEAVAKVPGANALIDYKEDTTVSSIMLFNTITYSLEGTAVKMEVGKQDIGK
jgi:hypothetical protein